MFPSNMKETLTLCGNSQDRSQKHPQEEIGHTERLVHLSDNFQTAFSSPIRQEPNCHKAQLLSVCQLNEERPLWQMDGSGAALTDVCVEVDRRRQREESELRSTNFTYAEISPLQSTAEREFPSEYYSFYSGTHMDNGDGSFIQPAELQQVGSSLDSVGKSGPKAGSQDQMVYSNDYTAEDDDQSKNFRGVMEDKNSILAYLTDEDVKAHSDGVHVDPLSTNCEAASSERLKPDQAVIRTKDTTEKYTSTELPQSTSAFTQTEDPGTSDKHVITEVHMADLDYLAEEFIKLKMAKEELREQKQIIKSSGCKSRKKCDCVQRAQQAELSLLFLQFNMCRQHCWRLYYTSAEGALLAPQLKNPPANVESVLQKLESDYNQMRGKILAGVPLGQLQPLSVDSERITTGANYIPAQIVVDVLGNVPLWSSQEPQERDASSQENGRPNNQSKNGSEALVLFFSQNNTKKEKQTKMENGKVRRAVTVAPKDKNATYNTHKQEKKQTEAACKELNTSEAWYDAVEDLKPATPAAAAETGQDRKEKTNKSTSEEAKRSALFVSNLPSDVTESDVMLWFEKYQACEVSISDLQKDFRVAMVTTNGPESAEAAARELSGCCMRGHTSHVQHISTAAGGSQSQSSEEAQSSTSDSNGTERKSFLLFFYGNKSVLSPLYPITQPPLSSSIKSRKVVCMSPTAKGTCVPEHYGTMGSFDSLMEELTRLHPDVGRQKIVDALIELRAEHRGVLSSLPLRTIREMTSELLTRPTSSAQT
ncbi:hypothetical protein L3Q82_017266 [Scortum barcoo]|uniref:Uncharacterized protein n=1 Tax=Scortum barcoo TaxID=214431 RepID=A0ACB8VKP9_9TELE|nr:hypothetical protein L3Q82_017266 [Scortum barcoo]